jgi:hypothetical protein
MRATGSPIANASLLSESLTAGYLGMLGPKRDWRRVGGVVAACGLIGLLARPGMAASLSPQDLQILGSTLAFVQPPPSAEGVVAIAYTGRDSASYRDAAAIAAMIGKGLTAGGSVLAPRLVDAQELATADFKLVIAAEGVDGRAVQEAARSHHALCVTGDRMLVQTGFCTMAIHSTGRVEILLNHQLAQASGINFATAFRMMVHEL